MLQGVPRRPGVAVREEAADLGEVVAHLTDREVDVVAGSTRQVERRVDGQVPVEVACERELGAVLRLEGVERETERRPEIGDAEDGVGRAPSVADPPGAATHRRAHDHGRARPACGRAGRRGDGNARPYCAPMPEMRMGTSTEHLVLARGAGSDVLSATLRLDGLTATRAVVGLGGSGFGDLVGYLSGLAAGWRGWDGARRWESLEHDLALEARHAHGHVLITVTLARPGGGWGDDGWAVRGTLTIEAGEQLSVIADEVSALVVG